MIKSLSTSLSVSTKNLWWDLAMRGILLRFLLYFFFIWRFYSFSCIWPSISHWITICIITIIVTIIVKFIKFHIISQLNNIVKIIITTLFIFGWINVTFWKFRNCSSFTFASNSILWTLSLTVDILFNTNKKFSSNLYFAVHDTCIL